MLVELRDVEVHIEPEEILSQALKEGDLDARSIIRECIDEESVEAVLDCIEHGDIERYCQCHDIGMDAVGIDAIITALSSLTNLEKAQLLWKLLECKG